MNFVVKHGISNILLLRIQYNDSLEPKSVGLEHISGPDGGLKMFCREGEEKVDPINKSESLAEDVWNVCLSSVKAITTQPVQDVNVSQNSLKSCEASLSAEEVITTHAFPPVPLDNELLCKVILSFCDESSPKLMEEAGFAVCGLLTPLSCLSKLKSIKNHLHILHAPGITRIEQKSETIKV